MDLKPVEEFLKLINFHDSNFCTAVTAIIFNPLFWNVVRAAVGHRGYYSLRIKLYCPWSLCCSGSHWDPEQRKFEKLGSGALGLGRSRKSSAIFCRIRRL